ncbi:MAG: adenine deaminase [Paludibacter sp.]|nr:adenine deaminase [Paludibacter sp.]
MIKISGNIVDVVNEKIYKGILHIENGKIQKIEPSEVVDNVYITPGLVDAHIHIESSMMLPAEFARHSVIHGTVACVCDPHEIANVCGVAGVDYMIENAKNSPVKFYFGAPSCVPSTHFETSGAILDAEIVERLLERDDIYFLAEMMNFPGVIHNNKQVHAKLDAAKRIGKPIDGHAPELKGADLIKYAAAGIQTDHECMTIEEAEAKMALGMTVQIREGSAAKNFDDLLPLLNSNRGNIMFCSDDKHPDDLMKNGHINTLVKRAVRKGHDPIQVLKICSFTPVKHYKLDVGLLQEGDNADFLIIDNLNDFNIKETYINGGKVAENGRILFPRYVPKELINQFNAEKIIIDQIKVIPGTERLKVIVVDDGQLFTKMEVVQPNIENGNIVSDIQNDILKLVVYNRYQPSAPAIGFIKNIGLKRGALASTVAHDSHNIVAVGTSDEEIVSAINQIIDSKGGILACEGDKTCLLSLAVGGLMSEQDGKSIASRYEEVDRMAKELGSTLSAPFMTVAFMSLLVIPEIKLGDKGLFDGRTFEFIDLME